MDDGGGRLDGLVDPSLRHAIEERYWRPIEAHCTLESFIDEPSFVDESGTHVALFSDHGVVHVRDVAARAVDLAATVNGVLLPARSPERLRFVQGLAVLLTYLHDIGMVDASPAGRRAHPQFAAHTPYRAGFDDLLREMLDGDAGAVPSRLAAVDEIAPFAVSLPDALREVLATSMAHSKTAVPAPLLVDAQGLRALLTSAVWSPLPGDGRSPAQDGRRDRGHLFGWLTSPHPAHRALADDVLDAVRVVRAADALRQRGTVFRTSAGYEVFLEAATGAAIAAVRSDDEQAAWFLRFSSPITTGETNIRYAEIVPNGSLRISFHRTTFRSEEVAAEVARHCAGVVLDIAADVLPSFAERRPCAGLDEPCVGPGAQRIELVATDRSSSFVATVRDLVVRARPTWEPVIDVLDHDPEPVAEDRDWAGEGTPVPSDWAHAKDLRDRLAPQGMDASDLAGVRLVHVPAGAEVVRAGTRGEWVLVPTGPGLEVRPLGGYRPSPLPAFVPLGVTGVVRGGERNASIVASTDVTVLAVPGEVFVDRWFRPYDPAGLRAAVRRSRPALAGGTR